jgi:membrane protease YdiL (CAAX protease family)
MFTSLSNVGKASVFYALALGMALVVALAVPDTSDGAPMLTMFTPLVAVLLMLLVLTRDGYARPGWIQLGLGRLGLRAWPEAIAVPVAVVVVCYLVAAVIGVVRLAPPGTPSVAGVLVGVLVSIVLGLAEEIGWRGYLLPLLTPSGTWRGSALTGLLHGVWHLPLMFFTTTYNPLGSRWVTVPVMLGVFACAGVFYGRLRLTTASLWPVVLAHQAFNSASEALDAAATTADPTRLAYLVGETGVLTLAAVAVVAVAVVRWDGGNRAERRRGGDDLDGAVAGHPG